MPNIKIRMMHGDYSTLGIFLEDGADFLCPKLQPGQVVTVPDDHPIFKSPASVHVEVTNEPATRKYRYDTLHEAMLSTGVSEDEATEAAGMIGGSIVESARIREENRAALEQAKADGVEIPADDSAVFAPDGLDDPRTDNAEPIGFAEQEQEATDVAPPSGGRRGRRRKRAQG